MRTRELALFAVCALAVAVVWTWPLAARLSTTLPHDPRFAPFTGTDTNIWAWNFWWARKVVEGGGHPFHCDLIFPPVGHGLALHTHTFLWGVLSVPLQWIGGIPFAVNGVLLLLFAAASTAAYGLAREVGVGRAGSAVCGLAWGLSPYFLQKGLVHFNLGPSPWMPLALLFLWRWTARAHELAGARRVLPALGLGIVVGLSFLTGSLQTVYLVAALLAFALVAPRGLGPAVEGVEGDDDDAPRARRVALLSPAALLVAALAAGVVAQPFLSEWLAQREGGAFGAFPQEHHPRFADFFTPSGLHPLFEGLGAAAPIEGATFALPRPEHAALTLRFGFLGLLLAGVVLVPAARRWALAFLLLFLVAWDPGPEPEGWLSRIYRATPPFDLLRVPARFLPAALLFASVAVGMGVDALARRGALGRVAAGALVLAMAFETWVAPYPAERIETPPAVRALAESDLPGTVLTLPPELTGASISMLWQTVYDRPASLSYVARFDPAVQDHLSVTAPFLVGMIQQTFVPEPEALALDLRALGVRHVLVRLDALSTPEVLVDLLDGMPGWLRYVGPGGEEDADVAWWYEAVIR